MTIDEQIVIDLSDIRSIQIECTNCGTAIVAPPGRVSFEVCKCPNCPDELIRDKSPERELLQRLVLALRGFAKGTENHSFQLKLRITKSASVSSASAQSPTSAQPSGGA